ncbi:hypothetical protein EBR77_00795 [bacterium]|jgi:hypothetical protein|nr:hypothetical protein [bacterium]NBX78657.1 hypothetical protein [bacterium]
MKNSIRFYKTDDGFYELEETNNQNLLIIAFFLLHDASENEELYKNWTESIEETFDGGTLTFVTKNTDGHVTINCILDEDDEFEPLTVTLSQKNFLDILQSWEDITQAEPEEIIIEEEDSIFSLR